ncbi:SpoIIE family protein phosphatase [Priestia megaterium]|nr:SpoIIE family protein phosphatase [Priestia megaterium]
MTLESNVQRVKTEVYQAPKKGNVCCGDSYYVKETKDYFLCVIADGLGSGEQAMAASTAVTQVAESYHHLDIEQLMSMCNDVSRGTRGAAVALLKFDKHKQQFAYTNVGNIRFYLYSPNGELTYPLPVKGFLSGKMQKFRTQTFSYQPGSKFLIHTDGLELKEIKSLFTRYINIIQMSEHLKKEICSYNDDITYIVGELPIV